MLNPTVNHPHCQHARSSQLLSAAHRPSFCNFRCGLEQRQSVYKQILIHLVVTYFVRVSIVLCACMSPFYSPHMMNPLEHIPSFSRASERGEMNHKNMLDGFPFPYQILSTQKGRTTGREYGAICFKASNRFACHCYVTWNWRLRLRSIHANKKF